MVGNVRLRVKFIADNIVRVTATRNRDWSGRASLMCVDFPGKPGRIVSEAGQASSILRSAKMRVKLDLGTGALAFFKADGTPLVQENPALPRTFDPVEVFKSMPDPASVTRVKTVDGERQVAGAYIHTRDRSAWKAAARFTLQPDEALYGLGFDETDELNLRGKRKRLYQHNLRIVVPFMVSTRGYGLLFDGYSALTFADGPEGMSLSSDVVDDLDYYVIGGDNADQAIAGYRQLTGQAAMLPQWAFGYMQSKERYVTQQELVETTQEFRRRRIPLDTIVQDWNYWVPKHWGSPVPDVSRYPDIAAMTKAVHGLDAKAMISIWPNPSPLDPPGKALKEQGYTLAGTDYVDFFQRKAGDQYFDHVWQNLGQHGIDAWWCDSTEPEVADWGHGAVRSADADELNILGLAKVIDPHYLNAYALVDSQSLYRNWRKAVPFKRLVNLTRSGYAGSQAAGAVVWTGDTSAKWSVLAQHVAALQSYSASGTPYVTCDIGAFFVRRGKQWFWNGDYDDGVADLGYRELYTRWLQFGVFLPLFRSHGTDTPREPWQFGEPGTPFYDAILAAIQLRYRLLPFIYSQAGQVSLQGASFIRPVAFAFPDDPRTHDLKSQMLFGDSLMVSPVLEPMYYAAKSVPIEGAQRVRDVYLPKGLWIDFWTGERIAGGRSVKVPAPLERMPVHVRAGSVIPVGPAVEHVGQAKDAPIELRIYPGADGVFTFYEDAGDGWGYERGEYTLTRMRWDDQRGRLTVLQRQGAFPGMARKRLFHVVVVTPGAGHGAAQPVQQRSVVEYDGTPRSIALAAR
jgi:alpha-D-xyloside xylohydrolase